MTDSRWQVKRIRWWNKPIPLMQRTPDRGLNQVGWVWNQTAFCVNNLVHGWIAFIEDQTPEKIEMFVCDHCHSAMTLSKQFALTKFLKEQKHD